MTSSGSPQFSVKNGADHIESVRDGRAVYLNGKLVHDVSVHPAYRNAVGSAAALYDYQAKPENVERMTSIVAGSCPAATPNWSSVARPWSNGPKFHAGFWGALRITWLRRCPA
jgi:hypothetical protein